MDHRSSRFFTRLAAIAVVVLGIVACHQSASAAPPSTLSHQGLLTDDQGVPLPNGSYDLTFKLWDDASAGSLLWSELHLGVPVQDGLFEVELGSITPFALDFKDPYHLSVALASDPDLTPRIALSATPYAMVANSLAAGAIDGTAIADQSVVRSLNGLQDDVDLVAGSNVTITPSGNSLLISAAGGGSGEWTVSGDDLIAEGPGSVGIGESVGGLLLAPQARLHVANVGPVMDPAGLNNDALVVSAQDAGIGLYSSDAGVAGSSLSFGEIRAGGFADKWSIFRETLGGGRGLRFTFGSSANYFANPVAMYLSPDHRVSVGSTSATHTFNVSGTARFDVGVDASLEVVPPGGGGIDPLLLPTLAEYGWVGTGAFPMYAVAANRFFASSTANYLTYSDLTLKEDVRPLEKALETVTRLRGVRYSIKREHFRQPERNGGEAVRTGQIGLIAQEVEEVLPIAVVTDESTGLKAVGYTALIPVLLEAIKEQQAMIDRLEQRIAALEASGQ